MTNTSRSRFVEERSAACDTRRECETVIWSCANVPISAKDITRIIVISSFQAGSNDIQEWRSDKNYPEAGMNETDVVIIGAGQNRPNFAPLSMAALAGRRLH